MREARALAAAARGDVTTRAPRGPRRACACWPPAARCWAPPICAPASPGPGEHLAALGLRLALAHRSPAVAFAWAEETRARALDLPPVRPPDDAELAQAVADARRLAAAANEAALDGEDARPLRRAQAGAEDAVRRRLRHLRGEAAPVTRLDRSLIGDRALVEYAVSDGLLVALVVTDGRVRRHDVGPIDDRHPRDRRAAVRARPRRDRRRQRARAGGRPRGPRSRRPDRSTRCWSRRSASTGRELVIVPTGGLHALAWSVLPSLAGRTFAVAPSAAAWMRAAAIADRPGHDVVLAGSRPARGRGGGGRPRRRHARHPAAGRADGRGGAGRARRRAARPRRRARRVPRRQPAVLVPAPGRRAAHRLRPATPATAAAGARAVVVRVGPDGRRRGRRAARAGGGAAVLGHARRDRLDGARARPRDARPDAAPARGASPTGASPAAALAQRGARHLCLHRGRLAGSGAAPRRRSGRAAPDR